MAHLIAQHGMRIAESGIQISELHAGKTMTNMKGDYLKERTRSFALRVIKLVEALSKSRTADVLGRQLLEAGTSVGANYRAACRAKSLADFVYKMSIVEEEADEAIYWMELLSESGLVQEKDVVDLMDEANQILAMTVSSIKTARKRN
jgi:four helix bundle protein